MPFALGQTIKERYRIERVISTQGGFGNTYLAYDSVRRHEVVLKVSKTSTDLEQDALLSELRILLSLDHPRLPKVFEGFFYEQQLCISMQYVPGRDVASYLVLSGPERRADPPDRPTALRWICQTLDALAYLHARGVVHRDVKPSNLRVHTETGSIYLLDFGISHDAQQTVVRAYTPRFSPPEQQNPQAQITPAADVYAVGATLYFLLTGCEPPYRDDRYDPTLRLPSEHNQTIPFELEQVVLKAMRYHPEERFADAQAMLTELQRLGYDLQATAPIVGTSPAPALPSNPTPTPFVPVPREAETPARQPTSQAGLSFWGMFHQAPPRLPEGMVPRTRLGAALTAATPARLTLVVAPAGFGKTVALAQWAAQAPMPVAWVGLSERDSLPLRFWGRVAAALDTVYPGLADHARSMLSSPTPPPPEVVVGALLDELETREQAAVLVLDDYHLMSEAAIHADLAFLIDQLPPSMRVVVASRSEPPLPIARWRLRGQVTELRASELRFTTDEVAALTAAQGLELAPLEIEALATRTEGWVGALTLAARSLQGSADPQGQIASFAGAQRHLFEFLADEVLRRQPLAIQRFLLTTSVLDAFCADLCAALLAESEAPSEASYAPTAPTMPIANNPPQPALPTPQHTATAAHLLDQIEAEGLFLLPLDAERRWFRYHTLFAEFLRERLRREDATRLDQLRRRAAAWYDVHTMPIAAVELLLAAGDAVAAAVIIEREGRPLLLRSEVATVRSWLTALPADLVAARPALGLIAAWAMALAGQFDQARAALSTAEATLSAYTGDPDVPAPFSAPYTPRNLASEALAVEASIAGVRRESARTVELARQALAVLPDDSVLVRGVVALMLGNAAYQEGDFGASEAALREAIQSGQAGQMPIITIFALRQLAELQGRAGQLHRAARTYEDAIAHGAALYPRRPGAPVRPVPVAGTAYVGLGLLRYEWGELDAAERLFRDGLMLGRQGDNVEILLMGPIGLARVQWARGQAVAARATMAGALAYARATRVPRLAHWLAAEQARLDLTMGDLPAAAAWDQERKLELEAPLSYLEELDFLALAWLRMLQGRPSESLRLLSRMRALAQAQGRGTSLIEIGALTALAYRAAGSRNDAMAMLAETLALAAPERYVRVFVDLGQPMAHLLDELLDSTLPERVRPYAEHVRAAFPPTSLSSQELAALQALRADSRALHGLSALVEPPTPRELEVLRWISEGLRNEEIAAHLVVTVATVKKHINNLYAKLEVTSRTQALKRARELGLLA
ncbi:MAG: protein kinase domain-containing protein [Oscillochloridaceae bacterium umkhey_bin13]